MLLLLYAHIRRNTWPLEYKEVRCPMDALMAATFKCTETGDDIHLAVTPARIIYWELSDEKQVSVRCLCGKTTRLALDELVEEAERLGCETVSLEAYGPSDVETAWLEKLWRLDATDGRPLSPREAVTAAELDPSPGEEPKLRLRKGEIVSKVLTDDTLEAVLAAWDLDPHS
jgi:hypothetical protein